MPQWDFLNFIAEKAQAPSAIPFAHGVAEVTDLIEENERVTGRAVQDPQGDLEVRRRFDCRRGWGAVPLFAAKAGLEVIGSGRAHRRSVVRLGRRPDDPNQTLRPGSRRKILVTLDAGLLAVCVPDPKGFRGDSGGRVCLRFGKTL